MLYEMSHIYITLVLILGYHQGIIVAGSANPLNYKYIIYSVHIRLQSK